jgi:Fe-S cluster biogenesis protein NfuA
MNQVFVQPTPNPNALKFILDRSILDEGKLTFKNPKECEKVPMAQALFDLRGVDQVHFFQNVITVSKFSFEPWDTLEQSVITTIENMISSHDPKIILETNKPKSREHLSPEMQKIEEILDAKIRPGLQGDGGDLTVESYQENILVVKYQGACGTCPSSTQGTLEAIRAILKDEFNPQIEVYTAPQV